MVSTVTIYGMVACVWTLWTSKSAITVNQIRVTVPVEGCVNCNMSKIDLADCIYAKDLVSGSQTAGHIN